MELRQLAHFTALAEERHFTRAASQLHLAQSSLSGSIRELERELGCALFIRSTRRVELTEAGRALLPAARQALDAAEQGRNAVAGVRGLLQGRLTIGLIQSLGSIDLPALIARFHRRHPGVALRVRHDSAPALVAEVEAGTLDLAFVDHPLVTRTVTEHPLSVERLVLVVPRTDPLAARDQVQLTDLAERAFVEYRADSALRGLIDSACHESGLSRSISCEVDNLAHLVALVANGVGIALLPPLTAAHDQAELATVAVEPPIWRELIVVTAPHVSPPPAAAALLTLVVAAIGGSGTASRDPRRRESGPTAP